MQRLMIHHQRSIAFTTFMLTLFIAVRIRCGA